MLRMMRGWMLGAAAVLLLAVTSLAADRVTLTSGEVLEGEIIEQTDSYLVLRVDLGGIESRKVVVMGEVASIEREGVDGDATGGEGAEDVASREVEREAPRRGRSGADGERNRDRADRAGTDRGGAAGRGDDAAIASGATRVAFLRLGDRLKGRDMVGPYLNGQALMRSAALLREMPEERRPEIVVLRIDSGGGSTLELEDIIEAIQDDLKKDFRVVGWIQFAISGAAFTAMNCEELVFMSSGQMGGNVAFSTDASGNATAARGEFLDWMLEQGRRVARNGRIDPKVMWAMQKNDYTLSADIDESGRVTWYDTDQGEYIVSPHDKVLTLNALDAKKFGVAEGIADNRDELMRVLGIEEWVAVGEEAAEYQDEYREAVWTAEARTGELLRKMEIALELAGSMNRERDALRQLGRAKSFVGQLRSLVRRAPSLERYGVPAAGVGPMDREFFRVVDERIREVEEQIEDRFDD